MTELKDIIEYVKLSCELNNLYPTTDMILDCATRIYNSNNFKGKESVKETKSNEPKATDKQIAYLIQLGYEEDTDKLDMTTARKLINELKDKKRKQ